MIRQQFWDEITDWHKLLDFCRENNLDTCTNIFHTEERDEHLNGVLYDHICSGDWSWTEIRDWLHNEPDGAIWYYKDDWDDFNPLDESDFVEWKEGVFDEAESLSVFDEDDEPEDDESKDEDDAESKDNFSSDMTIEELFGLKSAS